MQIREKLRHKEAYLKGKLKFNNLYYAKLLTQNPEENLDFYSIDYADDGQTIKSVVELLKNLKKYNNVVITQ